MEEGEGRCVRISSCGRLRACASSPSLLLLGIDIQATRFCVARDKLGILAPAGGTSGRGSNIGTVPTRSGRLAGMAHTCTSSRIVY